MDENQESAAGGTRAGVTNAVGFVASALIVLLLAALLLIVSVAIRRHAPLAVRVAFEALVGTAGILWILRRMTRQRAKRRSDAPDQVYQSWRSFLRGRLSVH
jgi:threonine/homoserine/homoserine lactone efflux protein